MNDTNFQYLPLIPREQFTDAKMLDRAFGDKIEVMGNWDAVIIQQAVAKAISINPRILEKHFTAEAVEEIQRDLDINSRPAARLIVERDGIAIIFCNDFAEAFWRNEQDMTISTAEAQKDKGITLVEFPWQLRLKELVRDQNPIAYLQKYLLA